MEEKIKKILRKSYKCAFAFHCEDILIIRVVLFDAADRVINIFSRAFMASEKHIFGIT